IKEYIKLEEEKARRRGKVFNWETATYAIVFNDTLTSEATLLCEPTISSLNNDEIDFRISFDESDDEDCTTSKLDFLTEPTLSPQHIDQFDLKSETSLSEYDEEEEKVLYFNDLFRFNVIYPDDSKSDKDNDDDEIVIKKSLGGGGVSIRRILGNGYRVSTSCTILGLRERKSTNVGGEFTNLEILKCWSLETSRRLLKFLLVVEEATAGED
ncbi:hypothetical protein Tco_1258913, partial [Tanacetum coccineum]